MNLVANWYNNIRQNWRDAATDELFTKVFWGNFIFCFAIYMVAVQWLKFNSTRMGTMVNDPVYYLCEPHDFSLYIGFCTYSVTIFTILYLLQYPHILHRAFTGFTVLFLIRAFCIFMIPLSPSADMIRLHDPFTNFVGAEDSITNDLFFSGHMADMAFFFLLVSDRWARRYILAAMICLGVMLVWQRVHYTLDVLAAPIFSYFCFWAFVQKDVIWSPFLKKAEPEDEKSSPGHVL